MVRPNLRIFKELQATFIEALFAMYSLVLDSTFTTPRSVDYKGKAQLITDFLWALTCRDTRILEHGKNVCLYKRTLLKAVLILLACIWFFILMETLL